MKHLLLALVCATALAGCSSEYIISTNDGQMIATDNKPKLDPDSGMYIFKDAEGREQAIPSSSVKQVMER
ncbi:YgdI/YgdR family lipoprotein [Halopseudomonas maritima]|uniref:YgdI/YgdR family lipoprotein n=1 Tax=Halopseudomonas maritima TaxID=2918528 RepID=UPI001EEA8E60|nr:YgdI/YgdR family lipoprotein [Halopseudomonas maritima]UJJ32960.1 YgdI/YgdR family lipoprotein [Halopseudomonas maritima]